MNRISLGFIDKFELFKTDKSFQIESGSRLSFDFIVDDDGVCVLTLDDGQVFDIPVSRGLNSIDARVYGQVSFTFNGFEHVLLRSEQKDFRVQRRPDLEIFTDLSPRPSVDPHMMAIQNELKKLEAASVNQVALLQRQLDAQREAENPPPYEDEIQVIEPETEPSEVPNED